MLRVDLQQFSPALKCSSLRVAANNLFDKTYVASCYGQAYCYWGDARSVGATLGYRW